MENFNYTKTIKDHRRTIFSICGVALLLALVISLILPFEYRSTVEVLVIQKQEAGLDPYTAIRSAERVAMNLSSIIYTTSFYDKVMSSGFGINQDYFNKDEIKKRKQWKKMIETNVTAESGMLTINVYHTDKSQSAEIARAISYILATEGDEWHGAGKNVTVKTIDSVLSSRYPMRPNILLNLLGALVLGTVLGSLYVVLKASYAAEPKINLVGESENETIVVPGSESRGIEIQSTFAEASVDKLIPAEVPVEETPVAVCSNRFTEVLPYGSEEIRTMHDHLNFQPAEEEAVS